MNDKLQHHGILGQKWGIRRYQNFDGSYTRAGVKRYQKNKEVYESAKSDYKTKKEDYKSGKATKSERNDAKRAYKFAKKETNKSYKKLKYDKLADQGKELYSKGKRILVNENRVTAISAGTTIAAAAASAFVTRGKTLSTKYGDIPLNILTPSVIAVGGAAVTGLLKVKNHYENKRLRAFYGHNSD